MHQAFTGFGGLQHSAYNAAQQRALQAAAAQMAQQLGSLGSQALYGPNKHPGASIAVPYEGITAGEIIGHRMWLVSAEGDLASMAANATWAPFAPMQGDPSAWGVHAFTDYAALEREYGHWIDNSLRYPSTRLPAVVGTVALWGETTVHELGYRATWGKVSGLTQFLNCDDATARVVRARYLSDLSALPPTFVTKHTKALDAHIRYFATQRGADPYRTFALRPALGSCVAFDPNADTTSAIVRQASIRATWKSDGGTVLTPASAADDAALHEWSEANAMQGAHDE